MNADDVVAYLREHPEFFRHRAGLFTDLLLPDPHDGRAASLPERQSALLRERIRALEDRLDELMRIGRDNDHLARQLLDWTTSLFACDDRFERRRVAIEQLQALFGIPVVSIRTWSQPPAPDSAALAEYVSRLDGPICGDHLPFPLLGGLDSSWSTVRSAAWIPLRPPGQAGAAADAGERCLGVLALGSPHADRFDAELGTAVLSRVGALASAALLHAAAPSNP
jgi:uncharacterized protein YigA (DUF484 family)